MSATTRDSLIALFAAITAFGVERLAEDATAIYRDSAEGRRYLDLGGDFALTRDEAVASLPYGRDLDACLDALDHEPAATYRDDDCDGHAAELDAARENAVITALGADVGLSTARQIVATALEEENADHFANAALETIFAERESLIRDMCADRGFDADCVCVFARHVIRGMIAEGKSDDQVVAELQAEAKKLAAERGC